MSVYVDQMFSWPGHKTQWCHMWADSLQELHLMASLIGLHREWFQCTGRRKFEHYDLKLSKRKLALHCGAKEMCLKEYIKGRRAV